MNFAAPEFPTVCFSTGADLPEPWGGTTGTRGFLDVEENRKENKIVIYWEPCLWEVHKGEWRWRSGA